MRSSQERVTGEDYMGTRRDSPEETRHPRFPSRPSEGLTFCKLPHMVCHRSCHVRPRQYPRGTSLREILLNHNHLQHHARTLQLTANELQAGGFLCLRRTSSSCSGFQLLCARVQHRLSQRQTRGWPLSSCNMSPGLENTCPSV